MNNTLIKPRNMNKVPATFLRLIVLYMSIVGIGLNSANAAIVNGTFDGITFIPGPPIIPGWSDLGLAPQMRTPPYDAFAPLGEAAFMGTPEAFGAGAVGGASPAEIATHLGISAAAIVALGNSPTFGAVIAQTFTANPGDVLSFQYNHTSVDDTYTFGHANDFSFVSLSGGPDPAILSIIADSSDLLGVPDSLTPVPTESGILTYTSPPLLGGTYTLGIGIFNSADNELGSSLIVDNVTLTAVPEAKAWLALGLVTAGVTVLTVARARIKKGSTNLSAV